ncbi:MAG TPA: hypothetical protein VGC74_16935 [Stenotrophomonas sp.]|jgi:hypothetical protein
MTNYVCRFPDGAAGLGLLLLRSCYASVAFGIAIPATAIEGSLRYPAASLIALLLALGLATRPAALLLGLAAALVPSANHGFGPWILAGLLGGCAAIALLGAGAFSMDARLHGRRVIHLQTPTPDRGDPD